ncbi:MarR family transcriptional regulator [Veillonella caviae]|uniref:MarR family winged helix-turn-helix transcriptional regulator n=1 Tax=Veillonella caviae TaxID=248316 RepID=UPI002A91C98D|nr:MarR family transcriptional regulator [Veillonella caviae]MDD7290990.1 MarR family transcriptional regulator [Veillonella caviae]MDY5787630.1 MarR family transcriptional regulator [Veillonella caviae]
MAKIGTLAGYQRVEDVPADDFLLLENQLGFPLYVVAKEIVNAYRVHLDPLNLTYTQYIVMMALWQYGELSVKELGQVLRLDSGTLTPLLKKLEAKGFLKRKRSRQDERVVMVILSDIGKELRSEVVQVPQKVTAQARGIFTVEEAVALRSLLNKLLDAIDMAHGVENPEDSLGKKS